MGLFDFLKPKKRNTLAGIERKTMREKETVKPKIERERKFYDNPLLLKRPLISERATLLAKEGKYIFEVDPYANKVEIKKAVEHVWPVEVESVNIINLPAKKIRLGKFEGQRRRRKKAIVGLKEGYSIELLPK